MNNESDNLCSPAATFRGSRSYLYASIACDGCARANADGMEENAE